MKVLIVEPDWRFAEQAGKFLESRAHLVAHESRAGATLDRVRRWQPELVILAAEIALKDDILDSLSRLPSRPAVLLTERLDRFDRAWRAWQKGGDELLIKPVLCGDDLHNAIVSARENATVGAWRDRVPARAAS